MLDETLRRHQDAPEAAVKRCQKHTDQPHVVIGREPADHRALLVIGQPFANLPEVVHQVGVRHRHTLRCAGRAGGVLEKSDVRLRYVDRRARRIHRASKIDIEQRAAGCLGVGEPRRAARVMSAAEQDCAAPAFLTTPAILATCWRFRGG